MGIELSVEVDGAPEGLEALLNRVFDACCAIEGIEGMEASGRLVDAAEIHRINREYRGVDRETDVLSFPSVSYPRGKTARDCPKRLRREYDPETGRAHLGDFVLSLPRAKTQAETYGHSLLRELGYLTAHSMFHLMGYDHENENERARMRELEENAMTRCGLTRENIMTDRELFEGACKALQNAYVPYSHFRVGACLLGADGRVFPGCNVENASYGATICAERTAVVSAVAAGTRDFTAIAVVGEEADAWPCGICRQVLYEFAPDMDVICGNIASGAFTKVPLKALLAHGFGPRDLGKSEAKA